jgi:hypothetical protein
MKTRKTIIIRIEAFLTRHGMTERQFGLAAVGEHKLLARLRAGKATLATIEKAEAYMLASADDTAA